MASYTVFGSSDLPNLTWSFRKARDPLLRTTTVRTAALLVALFAGHPLRATPVATARERIRIDRESLEADLRFLSSDALAGRGNGAEGLTIAARYLAQQFETLGLQPAGDSGTFFQSFRVMVGKSVGRHTGARLRAGERTQSLVYPGDFEPMTFSSAAELTAPVVFAGYGVTAPEHDYDDYEGMDVDGKAVLLLRYVPGHASRRGPFEPDGWHATFVRKAENAVSHGAVAVVVVNGPLQNPKDRLVPFGVNVGAERLEVPVIHLRRRLVEELFSSQGRSLLRVQRDIEEKLQPQSFELEGVTLELSVDVRRTVVEVANVLGYLPPTSRASLEHIIIGAHYDHLGLGEKGSRDRGALGKIHNGADDNASGVAGMLALARIFSDEASRPRGIVFAAFAGEELGLRGSYYYTNHPTHRLEDAVAMVNLDMIGRLRHSRLFLGGVELLPGLREVVGKLTEEHGLTFSTRFSAQTASDHASFIRAGVPALFFFTGLHGDYHKPTDDVQFIDFDGMERVIRLGYDLSGYLLRTPERPVLRVESGGRATASRRSTQTPYFGVGVDNDFEGEGVRLSYVVAGSPAAEAGLRAGDVLLELDGRAVRSGARASALIRQRRPGETVRARVRRNERILEVEVRLAQWP